MGYARKYRSIASPTVGTIVFSVILAIISTIPSALLMINIALNIPMCPLITKYAKSASNSTIWMINTPAGRVNSVASIEIDCVMTASNPISMITNTKLVELEVVSNIGREVALSVPIPIDWRIISVLLRIVCAIHQMISVQNANLSIPLSKDNALKRIPIV